MIILETSEPSMTSDNLTAYESALSALDSDPDDLDHKHRAVLALARAGSLDFALSEYHRMGMDQVRGHEDIMALGGRLYKDLYLTESGAKAKDYARLSALQYEIAFAETGGYYPAINSATMSLLSGANDELVSYRAQRVLDTLPDSLSGAVEAVYYHAATRAEAFLLLGKREKAQAELIKARDYDPLNFTAQASTLKQFHMIAKAREYELVWLTEFTPPKAVHFAGHIFTIDNEAADKPNLTADQAEALKASISEAIQSHDIGFGYGALAAGSDILIAEALLQEGGEIHAVLPVNKESFIAASVASFGESWVPRFETCLAQAASVTLFDDLGGWPHPMLQHRASLAAMGGAVRRASSLSVSAGQLLIWDGVDTVRGTGYDANIWTGTARPQYVITYPGARKISGNPESSSYKFQASLSPNIDETPVSYDNLLDGIKAAISNRSASPEIRQGLRMELINLNDADEARAPNLFAALPGAIHLNSLAANYMAVYHDNEFSIDFMGLDEAGQRVFAVTEKG